MAVTGSVHGFSLVDEAWIPVMDVSGGQREVSLRELFATAGELRMLACELPTQTFSILRLLLAILHRAAEGPAGEAAWWRLWRSPGLPGDVSHYLDEFRDRFDLLHPERPFYQVADLRSANDDFGLERLIADVPSGHQYLTSRAGSGLESISPAEAARWVVHCQAFDPSGIKSGAIGDPRVIGGRGYPIGVAAAGSLGGIFIDGATLRETLLLNLIPIGPGWLRDDERDLPIWERLPQGPSEESPQTRGPFGVLGLYTWQSRRLRLYGDCSGITGAMVSNGDKIEWQDRHLLEPMSVWSRSGPREKEQKTIPVYLPRAHDHTKALWRGLQTLLPQALPTGGAEPPKWLSPIVLQWLARLSRSIDFNSDFQVNSRAVSVAYGGKQAVTDQIFGDSLTMSVLVLQHDSALRGCVMDCAADADKAVEVLRTLALDLVKAAAGSGADNAAADRAAEIAYFQLDQGFRDKLARDLQPGCDPLAERADWQRHVSKTLTRIGRDLIVGASPKAWTGRVVAGRDGREFHYSSPQAEARFRTGLRRALPMAMPSSVQG